MRRASSACAGERATSHVSSPPSTSACTAGSDTTRSPRPNDTGAMYVAPLARSRRRRSRSDLRWSTRRMRAVARHTCCTVRNGGRRAGRCTRTCAPAPSLVPAPGHRPWTAPTNGVSTSSSVVHPALDEPREPGEERVGGVGERVALQRAQGDLVHPVQLAPDAGQGQEQQVPPGKVDGVVGRVVVRYVVHRTRSSAIRRRARSGRPRRRGARAPDR